MSQTPPEEVPAQEQPQPEPQPEVTAEQSPQVEEESPQPEAPPLSAAEIATIKRNKRNRFLRRVIHRLVRNYGGRNDSAPPLEAMSMDSEDLYIRWRVELFTKQGDKVVQEMNLKGGAALPEIFSARLLTEANRNFEGLIGTVLLRPLNSKFQKLTHRYVRDGDGTAAFAQGAAGYLGGKT